MTTETTSGRRTGPQDGLWRLLVGGAAPAGVVSVVCALVAAFVVGAPGLRSAAVAFALVLVFFALSVLVLSSMRGVDPALTLVVALALYTGKVVALAVGVVLLSRTGWLDGPLDPTSLAVTVILATIAWSIGEVVATVRRREPLYDLGGGR